ncbi:oligosaccharide flippase family protein [Rhizobium miluonense]|uniref:Membrane protein involved in the export of O-antigen and teichoic acid n=1 Tax=Rhizobium miluonense TaxID=411945 RepID=A0A1C3WEJ9_9HYPH|nr:oligosaccharide flippase family protein [Rhizobium miluonense]SCB38492.1 Membrane protein involved in the export of O-antigen and teichoic acid [Rhizobium miluonense]
MDSLSPRPKGVGWASLKHWLRSRTPAVIGDGASTLVSKIVSQAVQLLIFLVAARALESAEFGLYAFSSAIVVMLVVIAEGGWGEFVMKAECTDRELDQIGTISILAGVLVTIIGAFSAAIAWFLFHRPHEALLLALFSCWFLPASLYAVYEGLLIARGLLRKQSIIRIASEIAGLCVTMLGLWLGWNVFSLAAGRLVSQLVCLAGSAAVLGWCPRLHLTWPFAREVLGFSGHILSNRLILFLRSYSGTLAIGSFLGLTEAGYFRVAERIVAAFSELIGEPARMLAWTLFRRSALGIGSDGRQARDIGPSATVFMMVLMAISTPVYLGLSLISSDLIDIVLGEKWAPAAILVAILSVKQVLLMPGYVTEALLSLSGNIRRMPPALLFNAVVSVALVLALAPFGVVAAAWGQCVASLVAFLTSMRLQKCYGGLGWAEIMRKSGYVAIAVALMAAAVTALGYFAGSLSMQRVLTVLLQVVSGGAIYVCTLLVLKKVGGGTATIP